MKDSLAKLRFQQLTQLPEYLCWFGDPVLREVASVFDDQEFAEGSVNDIAKRLGDTLKLIRDITGLGRAIAAPQIGISKRIFVYFDPETNEFTSYVNPEIVHRSDTMGVYKEMCLSGIPLTASVQRSWEVEMKFYDLTGVLRQVQLAPMMSRVVQHEIDHLDGILFIDHVDPKSIEYEFDWEAMKSRNTLTKVT